MAWYLSHEDEHVRIGAGRVVGRGDFVDAPTLSKSHLKFGIDKNVLVVRDLGSTNGTRLGGFALTPNVDYPVPPGSVLTVDDLELRVDWYRPNFAITLGVAAILLAYKLVLPGAALGHAIGRYALVNYAGSALVAAVVAVLLVHFVVPAHFRRSALVAALVLAAAFDLAQLMFLARRTRLVESVVQARINYYCLQTFDGLRCVDQVQACPTCAVKIEKWKRELIVRRLAAADKHQPLPTK